MAGEFGREFSAARAEQGFTSQGHLDAFFAHRDHVSACLADEAGGCHEGAAWVCDSQMTVIHECEAGKALYRASLAAKGA